MRLDEAETYRTTEVNRDLYRLYLGADLVGQIRRGIDGLWYPELPGEQYKTAALQRVILANDAITTYLGAISGDR